MTAMMDLTLERWVKAKVAEGVAQGLAQGMERGLAQGRVAMLGRIAERRFGAGVGAQLTTLPADESDLSSLDAAGGWLVECDTGEALLARIRAGARGRATTPPPDRTVAWGPSNGHDLVTYGGLRRLAARGGRPMPANQAPSAIPELSSGEPPDALHGALAEAGCLVVTDALPLVECQRIERELAGEMAGARVTEDNPEDFYPGRTRRVTGLVSRSETVREVVLHDLSRQLAERHLGANCERIQLHVTAALSIGPGARAQVLHREEDLFPFFPVPRPNLILASMWAISDFTADNGGTLLVPGSHRWEGEREATPNEVAAAEMPAGSVLYWLGGTLHGGGANVSNEWRYGVILTYSLGWLRQEENQYLDVPPEVLATLTPELQALTGHVMHGGLGFSVRGVPAAAHAA